jgi:hypothetical protein
MEEQQRPEREAVVYLYIKEFNYKDKNFENMMGGHPKAGRIYRALYDTDSSFYRIILEDEDKGESNMAGIILQNLQSEDPRWSANITVMDDESMINYDIVSEDFIKLARWKEQDNKDIDYLRIDVEGTARIETDPANGMTTIHFENEEEGWEDVTSNLAELSEVDYDLAKATDKAIEGILHFMAQTSEARPDLNYLISNHPVHGKGANISLAVEALADYLNNDPPARGTLNKAVYYLLRELTRINRQ